MSDNTPPLGNEQPVFPTPPPPPPGFTPPPGYTPFGGYQASAGMLPTAYAIPPTIPGQEFTAVPPATGTVIDAWRSIGTKFSRQNIAGWSNASNDQWTIQSIIAGAILSFVGAIIRGLIILSGISGISGIYANSLYAATIHTAQRSAFVSFLLTPVAFVLGILGVALGLALFMSPTYGDIQQRMRRAIKPVALAAVPVGVVFLIYNVLSSFAARNAYTNLANAVSATDVAASVGSSILGVCITFLVGIPVLVYSISMFVQACSVGSSMNRWPAFGSALLGGLIAVVAILILNVVIGFPMALFIH